MRDQARPTLTSQAGLWFAAALSGSLIAATFLDFSLYPLAWFAFVPLLWAIDRASNLRAAVWVGLIGGLVTNVPAFHWLVHTMRVFGGFPLPIAVFFYACLSLYASMQFVLFAAAFRRLSFGPLGLAPPVLWVTLEFLYPNLFPWRLANSQFHAPLLLQIGDITGPFGLSFVMVWLASGVFLVLRRPRRPAAFIAAFVSLLLVLGYSTVRWFEVAGWLNVSLPVRVGLVQGNVGIREKGDAAYFEINIEKYRTLSTPLQDDVDLLVWPESVAQWWVPTDAKSLVGEENPFPGLRSFLLFGGLAYDDTRGEGKRYNSAFLIDPGGDVLGRYDKQILLPFGEYLPGASIFPGLASLSPQTGALTAGERFVTLDVPGRRIEPVLDRAHEAPSVTLDIPGPLRLAPLICYEDVPAGIARAMTASGADVLVTIFNDAWFGRSMAPYQHEALALWRAVENRRFFLRVGNAGATSVIDPLGQVVDRLGLFTAETLTAKIKKVEIATFYTRHGDLFAWLLALVAVYWLAFGRRQPRGADPRSPVAAPPGPRRTASNAATASRLPTKNKMNTLL